MWRLLTNKFLYIFFFIFLIIFYFVFIGNASSSSIKGSWAVEQNINLAQRNLKRSDLDDTVIGTVVANIKLGNSTYNSDYYLSKSLELSKTALILINLDVIELLEGNQNKPIILETHFKQIEDTLSEIKDITAALNSTYIEKKQLLTSCENQKALADKNFFNGIQNNQSDLVLESIQNSLKNGECYIQNRVIVNSYGVVLDQLNFYQLILQEKFNLLTTNQDLILQNFGTFKNNFLEKLVLIRDKLNEFKINNI